MKRLWLTNMKRLWLLTNMINTMMKVREGVKTHTIETCHIISIIYIINNYYSKLTTRQSTRVLSTTWRSWWKSTSATTTSPSLQNGPSGKKKKENILSVYMFSKWTHKKMSWSIPNFSGNNRLKTLNLSYNTGLNSLEAYQVSKLSLFTASSYEPL